MALTQQKKKQLVNAFEDIVKNHASIVFVQSQGLPVSSINQVRNALHAVEGGYTVVKKTLLKRVLAEAGIKGDLPSLDGEIAIAYANDLTAPAREVFNFAKKTGEKMVMVGGIFEGAYMNASEIAAVAAIPDTTTLRGMFVNVINSPIQGLVIALSKIAEKKTA